MKFSIIVPCYNLERYIGEALDSVLAQTFGDYECIVVDDGSTDNSPRIVDEYAARDSRIKVIHKPNGGEGSARNAGLEVARGEWLVFLDGDDVWAQGLLLELTRAINGNSGVDIFTFGGIVFNDGIAPNFGAVLSGGEILDCRNVIPNCLGMISVCQMAYRRDKFGVVRFKHYKVGADLVYTSKCFALANVVYRCEFVGHGYRIRAGSAAHSSVTKQKMMDRIDYRREMFENFFSSGKKPGAIFLRGRGNLWVRDCASEMEPLCEAERQEIFAHWIKSLESAKKMPFFSWWQKLSVRLLLATKSRLVAKLLAKVRNPF